MTNERGLITLVAMGTDSFPIAQQNDLRKIRVRRVVKGFISRHALDAQVLSERDEQGVIKRAVILYRDLEFCIEKTRFWLNVYGQILQVVKKLLRLLERY